MLRQYIPKGGDMKTLPPDRVAFAQMRLNTRPRKSLDYLAPIELIDQLIQPNLGALIAAPQTPMLGEQAIK